MALASERRDEEHQDSYTGHVAQAAETLRSSEESRLAAHKSAKAEDRINVFWRLFGGTMLSIVALVCITAYQQLSSTLSELRSNQTRLQEGRADLVRNDEFNNRLATVWTSIKELQASGAAMSALKERSALLEQQLRSAQEQLNGRITTVSASFKDVDAATAAISALKERSALLEQQVKTAETERKELVQQLQHLRERLAALEGRQVAAPRRQTAVSGDR